MKTLKSLLIICLGALMFTGCEKAEVVEKPADGGAEADIPQTGLYLHISKRNVYDNGEDKSVFTVYLNGQELQEGYTIYLGDENPVEYAGKRNEAGKMTFSGTVRGTYLFWVMYGTLYTDPTYINVIPTPPAAPAAPEDLNPSKTNFKRRVLLTQFTGTGCGYCPNMMNALYQASNAKSLNDKFVLAAAHLYNKTDPAYLVDAQTLDNSMAVKGYPILYADLNNATSASATYPAVTKLINDAYDLVKVKGGIAVSSEYHEDSGFIVLNALVKAKETAHFRIGAWLLEDNISGVQTNYGTTALDGVNFNIHNNCIRFADSAYSDTDFSGHYLASIEAGEYASHEFAFKLEKNWKADNLRVIVFISTKENGKWLVNNVVKCPKHGSVDFEYEN